jgi:SAM-dependent methyltransferase
MAVEVRYVAMRKLIRRFLNRLESYLLTRIRAEYTVMPRFGFHQPLDYLPVTLPHEFEKPEIDPENALSVPTGKDRFGYSPNDTEQYLKWGRYDHDQLIAVTKKYGIFGKNRSILDFGCSSGRVLRHFDQQRLEEGWLIHGCDVQAVAIQWIREFLPESFNAVTTSVIPHLPYEDNTFDFIYGFSVFTHIKFQWDAWLLELRRVLKPGGVMVQTFHSENAWDFYHKHQEEGWVRANHTPRVYERRTMDVDYLYFGDISVSQVFWKKEIAKKYWQRYLEVLEVRDPPEYSFQDWIICRKT